ncbi:MAG: hypothetical protein H7222_08410 [Methylotenera sp.]|nr:hypothetical protein [Oligoflexia bacterium]
MNPTAFLPTPMTEKDHRKRLLKIWFFGFLGLFAIIGSLNLWKLFRLMRDGVPTSLIIRAVDSDRRQTLHYSYVVDQVSYEGEDAGIGAGEGAGAEVQVKVGDRLQGYALLSDPSVSCIGEPGPQLRHEAGLAFLVALLVPGLVTLRASRRYKKWLKKQSGGEIRGA